MIRSGLAAYHPALKPLLVPIDTVTPHPDNYNNGDIDAITASIETNGMYRPLYVQQHTGYILSGNHTWYACKQLDATDIPVVYLDVDDNHGKAIMVADNKIASLAIPDPGLLLNLLGPLSDADLLTGTGYTDRDLDLLRHLSEMELTTDDYAQWPVLTFRIPPHVRRAFYVLTDAAVDDRERFELLLRMGGWDGHDPR